MDNLRKSNDCKKNIKIQNKAKIIVFVILLWIGLLLLSFLGFFMNEIIGMAVGYKAGYGIRTIFLFALLSIGITGTSKIKNKYSSESLDNTQNTNGEITDDSTDETETTSNDEVISPENEESPTTKDEQLKLEKHPPVSDSAVICEAVHEQESKHKSNKKIKFSPYIIVIATLIFFLAGAVGYSIININNKTEKISKLEKISIEYQSEKSEMSAKIDSLENQPDIYNDSIVRFANSQYGNQVSDKFDVKQTVVMKIDDGPITIKMKYSGTDKINISNHDKIIKYSMSETSIHGTYDITISPLDKGSTILTLTERLGKVIDPEYYNILVIVV